jgi:hypothetical protein
MLINRENFLFCLGFCLLILIRCFLCILLVYLGAPYTFYKFRLLVKKKINSEKSMMEIKW